MGYVQVFTSVIYSLLFHIRITSECTEIMKIAPCKTSNQRCSMYYRGAIQQIISILPCIASNLHVYYDNCRTITRKFPRKLHFCRYIEANAYLPHGVKKLDRCREAPTREIFTAFDRFFNQLPSLRVYCQRLYHGGDVGTRPKCVRAFGAGRYRLQLRFAMKASPGHDVPGDL